MTIATEMTALIEAHNLTSLSFCICTRADGRTFFAVYPQRETLEGRESAQGIGDTPEKALAKALPVMRVLEVEA